MSTTPAPVARPARKRPAFCRILGVTLVLLPGLLAVPAAANGSGPISGPAAAAFGQTAMAGPRAVAVAVASEPEPRPLEERRPKTLGQWLARNAQLLALALGLGAVGLGVVMLAARKRK